jgi:glycosyltransferase involved in cell wall biosynthesis
VMIEAMACGTPGTGWHCGSLPEVIRDGMTDIIVQSGALAVEAVHAIDALDRHSKRSTFESRFSALDMADAYTAQYRNLTDKASYALSDTAPEGMDCTE